MSSIPLGSPLIDWQTREPVVYPALGVILHIESLTPADESRLRDAANFVDDWIGSELRYTENSTFPMGESYHRGLLEYVPGYAKTLGPPPMPYDADAAHVLNCIHAATFGEFSSYFTGAQGDSILSPYSFEFSMEMHERYAGGPLFTCGIFKVTVPTTWPLHDFKNRVRRVVELLPIRWGAAGYTYSAWLEPAFHAGRRAIYAHARRHLGFDVGNTDAFAREWHAELRSVSWLTYLGGEFIANLQSTQASLVSTPEYALSAVGSTLEIQAGAGPLTGDVDRLEIPPAYAAVDQLLRPLRAKRSINFTAPWTLQTSSDWLCRFESAYLAPPI